MSSGLILNHISASGNHTQTISGHGVQGALYVTGAAAFGMLTGSAHSSARGASITWPGSDATFFVSGSSGTNDATTAVFGGNVFVSGALSAGSITGGLSAAGTPVAQQVAVWTGASTLKGDANLYWDDSDLVVNGNLQVQGSTTTISSSNVTLKDSIIGIGITGSDTFDNLGDRGLIFGRGANAYDRLPAVFFDGDNSRMVFAKTPTSPLSASFNKTFGDGTSAAHHIRVPHTASTTNDLLDVHMGKFVSPVAAYGTVDYTPALSGTYVDDGYSSYTSALETSKLKVGKNAILAYGADTALRVLNGAKVSWRDSGISINSPADGQMRITADGSSEALQLSASSGHIGVNAQALRADSNNNVSLGTSTFAFSDLFLADGGVINFNAGNASLTHSTDTITVKGHWVPDADDTHDLGTSSSAWDVIYADSIDFNGHANAIVLDADGDTKITAASDDVIVFTIGSNAEFEMDTSSFYPSNDNQNDLGSTSLRFRNIYTGDLNLQNDRGDWTLIEESDFLSFRNNKTGQRYRMIMEDITGMGNYGPGNDGEM